MSPIDVIFNHSCISMPEISDNTVSLTVTSPPYWDIIDYTTHATDDTLRYRNMEYSNSEYKTYNEYLVWLTKVFDEVFRVTKPGGFCAIVLGTILKNKRLYPVPFDIVTMLNRKWSFHQDILWHKCTARGKKRAGVAIQHPYPGYYYPNIIHEYILIFRKDGQAIYKNRSDDEKVNSKYEIDTLFTGEIANSIWHIPPVPPNKGKLIGHPASFPEEIPYRLIQLYSYRGEIVLDPFAGSGTTLKVAKNLGRRYIGYETISKYVQIARKRVDEPLNLRMEQIIPTFSKVRQNAIVGGA